MTPRNYGKSCRRSDGRIVMSLNADGSTPGARIYEIVLAAIRDDWARLSMDPKEVAERIAIALVPLLELRDTPEIQGQPWSAR